MSGTQAPAGDFEESGEFEESKTDVPTAQRTNTAGSYGDDFEGDAPDPTPAGDAKGLDRTYSDSFEADESVDASATAPVAAAVEPAAAPEPGAAEEPPAEAPPAEAPAAEAPPAGGAPPPAEAPPAEAPPVEAPSSEAPPAEAPPAEATSAVAPPAEAPPAEAPPAEAPPAEVPPAEAPSSEAPPAEAPPAEAPSAEAPSPETVAEAAAAAPEPATAKAEETIPAAEAPQAEAAPAAAAAPEPSAPAAGEGTQEAKPPPKEERTVTGLAQQGDGDDTEQVIAEAEHLLSTSPVAKDATAADGSGGPSPKRKGPKRKDESSMSRSASGPSVVFGDFKDIKRRTEAFGGMSTEGVKKGQTYATHIAGFKSSPKFTMGARDKNPSFLRANSVPAPGAYEAGGSDNTKYTNSPNFAFGNEKRFGSEKNPSKRQPGPGQYNPKASVESAPKIGFGSSQRLKGAMVAQSNPGPGAYETRSCLGEGLNYTARGRIPVHYMAAKSLPGPGAYNPTVLNIGMSGPRTGFGTSRRNQHGVLRELGPGPGSYELQNLKTLGTEGPKTSMTSRRRQHDINSYLTPGPGSYNSHATCFGGP